MFSFVPHYQSCFANAFSLLYNTMYKASTCILQTYLDYFKNIKHFKIYFNIKQIVLFIIGIPTIGKYCCLQQGTVPLCLPNSISYGGVGNSSLKVYIAR